jgi:hypothetical protein
MMVQATALSTLFLLAYLTINLRALLNDIQKQREKIEIGE